MTLTDQQLRSICALPPSPSTLGEWRALCDLLEELVVPWLDRPGDGRLGCPDADQAALIMGRCFFPGPVADGASVMQYWPLPAALAERNWFEAARRQRRVLTGNAVTMFRCANALRPLPPSDPLSHNAFRLYVALETERARRREVHAEAGKIAPVANAFSAARDHEHLLLMLRAHPDHVDTRRAASEHVRSG